MTILMLGITLLCNIHEMRFFSRQINQVGNITNISKENKNTSV